MRSQLIMIKFSGINNVLKVGRSNAGQN